MSSYQPFQDVGNSNHEPPSQNLPAPGPASDQPFHAPSVPSVSFFGALAAMRCMSCVVLTGFALILVGTTQVLVAPKYELKALLPIGGVVLGVGVLLFIGGLVAIVVALRSAKNKLNHVYQHQVSRASLGPANEMNNPLSEANFVDGASPIQDAPGHAFARRPPIVVNSPGSSGLLYPTQTYSLNQSEA